MKEIRPKRLHAVLLHLYQTIGNVNCYIVTEIISVVIWRGGQEGRDYKETWRNFGGGWWICSLYWVWWHLQECIYTSKFIKLCTLIMSSLIYVNYALVKLVKKIPVRKLNIVKMSIFPNLIYRFSIIPIKISAHYFVDIDKLILKFI